MPLVMVFISLVVMGLVQAEHQNLTLADVVVQHRMAVVIPVIIHTNLAATLHLMKPVALVVHILAVTVAVGTELVVLLVQIQILIHRLVAHLLVLALHQAPAAHQALAAHHLVQVTPLTQAPVAVVAYLVEVHLAAVKHHLVVAAKSKQIAVRIVTAPLIILVRINLMTV